MGRRPPPGRRLARRCWPPRPYRLYTCRRSRATPSPGWCSTIAALLGPAAGRVRDGCGPHRPYILLVHTPSAAHAHQHGAHAMVLLPPPPLYALLWLCAAKYTTSDTAIVGSDSWGAFQQLPPPPQDSDCTGAGNWTACRRKLVAQMLGTSGDLPSRAVPDTIETFSAQEMHGLPAPGDGDKWNSSVSSGGSAVAWKNNLTKYVPPSRAPLWL